MFSYEISWVDSKLNSSEGPFGLRYVQVRENFLLFFFSYLPTSTVIGSIFFLSGNIMEFLDHLMQTIILQNMNILSLLPPSLLLLQTGNRGNDKIRQFYVANIPCLYKLAFITILRLSEDVIYMKEGNFVRKSISQQFGLRYRRVNKKNHMFA